MQHYVVLIQLNQLENNLEERQTFFKLKRIIAKEFPIRNLPKLAEIKI